MTSLLILACLIVLPALLTWGLVRFIAMRDAGASRARILAIAVPTGAIVPLLPAALMVARSAMINNAVPIAVAATMLVGAGVALFICLPVGLACTRHLGR